MSLRTAVLVVALAVLPVPWLPASAAPAPGASAEPVEESALDRHTYEVAQTLRCLVCQGESVADSQAALAADMRTEIRTKLQLGWSDQRVRNYFVARYGDYVLYRPPLVPTTWLLWLAPLLAIVLGILGMLWFVRGRGRHAAASLTPAEVKRAQALLHAHGEELP